MRSPSRRVLTQSSLIIHDLDKLFLGGPSQQETLNFLLDYLDPEKGCYPNKYFNCPIDISRLIVIITGNGKLPTATQNAFDTFKALRERLIIIHVPPLSGGISTEDTSTAAPSVEPSTDPIPVSVYSSYVKSKMESLCQEYMSIYYTTPLGNAGVIVGSVFAEA